MSWLPVRTAPATSPATKASKLKLKDLARAYQNLGADATRTMTRITALYRGRGLNCDGHTIYTPEQRQAWLAKLRDEGARFRCQMLFEQLEKLQELRRQAKQELRRDWSNLIAGVAACAGALD